MFKDYVHIRYICMKNTRKIDYFFFVLSLSTLTTCISGLQEMNTQQTTTHNSQHASDIDLTLPIPEEANKKKSKKKSPQNQPSTTESKKVTNYKKMSFEELEKTKNRLAASGNLDIVIKYLEQMIKLCTDVYVIADLLLEMGDILFKNEQFKKAALVYSEFTILYPGHEKVEFALYRSIISSWNCCLSSDRDQTKTEETIVLADTFLISQQFIEHRDEIITIRMQCYNKLIESEFNTCRFYLQRGNFKAVKKRLGTIREKWLPIAPSIIATLLDFEIKLAEKTGDLQTIALKTAEQIEYNAASSITIAQASTKTRMIDRF